MATEYLTGGQITAWCTKCKLELEHTIAAMVENVPKKVTCNTCGGNHNYRARAPQTRRATLSSPSGQKKSREAAYEEYLFRLTQGDLSKAKKYSIEGSFLKDEVIEHLTFGAGIVLSVIQENKIEVLFRNGPKLLVQNQ